MMNMQNTHIYVCPWDDSLKSGVVELDQHKEHLVKLLNNLVSLVTFQVPETSLDSIIEQFVEHVQYHLDGEENYYRDAFPGFSNSDRHRQIRSDFFAQIDEFTAKAGIFPDESRLEELLVFLSSWLIRHIVVSNKYLQLMFEASQSGMSSEQRALWVEEKMQLELDKNVLFNLLISTSQTIAEHVTLLMQEIIARKLALDKLSDSERRLTALMNYAKVGYWSLINLEQLHDSVTDPEYLGDCSPELFRMFGLPKDSIFGREVFYNTIQESHRTRVLESIKDSFRLGKAFNVEFPIQRPSDSEIRWIECHATVVYCEDGKPHKLSGFAQDITTRKESEIKLHKLSHYDPLTQLKNRRMLLEKLQQINVTHGSRFDARGGNALLVIDIDNFKILNDIYGNEYGDALLQQTAMRLSQYIRQEDTLARTGGDEFAIVLTGLHEGFIHAGYQVSAVASKVLKVISEPYMLKDIKYNGSVSIGIVLFENGQTGTDLMRKANIAMNKAKQLGRNTVCFFGHKMQKEVEDHLILENELRLALKEKQFELYFQPQVDQFSQIIGAEALIRWAHPTRGLVAPDGFIPYAESNGLIIPIGNWVLHTACAQLKKWQSAPETKHLILSINVSAKQICQPSFVSLVRKLIGEYKIVPGKLTIELTETMLADDVETIIAHMKALKKIGIGFSLDDFGTGYSSLSYLNRLPLTGLKIDRAFVSEIGLKNNQQSIIKMIISMSNALGLGLIAEGVETVTQLEYLRSKGCLAYQGYLFSKPVPIDDFNQQLTKQEKISATKVKK